MGQFYSANIEATDSDGLHDCRIACQPLAQAFNLTFNQPIADLMETGPILPRFGSIAEARACIPVIIAFRY
jgi:hypothetical protein